MSSGLERNEILLKLTSNILNALLEGLESLDENTREKLMIMSGKACAHDELWGPAIKIAEKIVEEEKDLSRIISRATRRLHGAAIG